MSATKTRPKYSDALNIAARWLSEMGACTHYPGYTCDQEFTQPGVCEKCLRRYFLKMAREEKK